MTLKTILSVAFTVVSLEEYHRILSTEKLRTLLKCDQDRVEKGKCSNEAQVGMDHNSNTVS